MPHLSFASAVVWMLPVYLVLTLLVGWLARRASVSASGSSASAGDFLNASQDMALPVVVAAYLASNCGALEVVGLSAMASQYGVQAFHFYWVGAIPGMIFLALFMMPVYRRSGVRSVPEYLLVRFGPRLRLLNSVCTAIVLLLLSGIGLYAIAQVLGVVLGFRFTLSVTLSSSVVLAYVLLGGVRATVYNEVLQLAVMIGGLLPLAIGCFRLSRQTLGGHPALAHLWTTLPVAQPHSTLDLLGVSVGLGFVLSFGYWCTDFVLMQRALMARTDLGARAVPLLAGFGKLLFSFLVVLPGLAAVQLFPELGHSLRFDQALPATMERLSSPWLLGLGLTALAASLMSGLAANVSAFAAIWTEDLYRTVLRPGRREEHYLRVGRAAACGAAVAGICASYLNFLFSDLMEHVQLIFSVFGSPFFAIFLLGMGTRRTSERGALAGFLTGAAVSATHSLLVLHGTLHYGSTMSANFYGAILGFGTALAVAWVVSLSTPRPAHEPPASLDGRALFRSGLGTGSPLLWTLAGTLAAVCLLLNLYYR